MNNGLELSNHKIYWISDASWEMDVKERKKWVQQVIVSLYSINVPFLFYLPAQYLLSLSLCLSLLFDVW